MSDLTITHYNPNNPYLRQGDHYTPNYRNENTENH